MNQPETVRKKFAAIRCPQNTLQTLCTTDFLHISKSKGTNNARESNRVSAETNVRRRWTAPEFSWDTPFRDTRCSMDLFIRSNYAFHYQNESSIPENSEAFVTRLQNPRHCHWVDNTRIVEYFSWSKSKIRFLQGVNASTNSRDIQISIC